MIGLEPKENIGSPEDMKIPEPRASHTTDLVNGKLYVFGGRGGTGYQRKCFNDI